MNSSCWVPLHLLNKWRGWSLSRRSISSGSIDGSIWQWSSEYSKLESLLPLRGVPLRGRLLAAANLWSRRAQRFSFPTNVYRAARVEFSHSNFPFCPQFGLVTFFESLITTSITSSTWADIHARKTSFQGCSLKNRSSSGQVPGIRKCF